MFYINQICLTLIVHCYSRAEGTSDIMERAYDEI